MPDNEKGVRLPFHISNTVNTDRRKGYQIKLVKVNRIKTQI